MYPKWRPIRIASALVALLPLAYLVWFCAQYHVDVPFWDEWELVPRLARLASGTLTFHDLWMQHNEHRPVVPIALMLALARLSAWNIGWEIAVNVALGAAIFGIFWTYLRRAWRSRGGAPFWLLPLLSALVFSPVQWENWLWGWQMTVLMCSLASLLTAYLVASSGRSRAAFAWAIVSATWASWSVAAGLVTWLAQPAGLWASGATDRLRRLAIWTVAGAATFAAYFHDYHAPAQPPLLSNFRSLPAIWRVVQYTLTYLGAPLTAFREAWAPYAGAVVVALFVWLTVRLRALREDPAFLFPALAGWQTLSVAGAAALSRAWMGADQALSSRYASVSIPIWCAVACLAALWRPASGARARTAAMAAALCALLALLWASGSQGAYYAAGRSETLRFARRGLIVGRSHTLLLMLYPNLEAVREYRATLLRLRLSVFRPTAATGYPRPAEEHASAERRVPSGD